MSILNSVRSFCRDFFARSTGVDGVHTQACLRNQHAKCFEQIVVAGCIVSALACSKGQKSRNESAQEANQDSSGVQDSGETANSLPQPAELFAAHVKASGGKEVADNIKSLYIESSIDIDAQNLHGTAKVWWSRQGYYSEEAIPGLGITRSGSDGTLYWSDDPVAHLRQLSGKEAEQYKWASNVFLVNDWESYFPKAKTTGEREVGGKKVVDVTVETPLGEQVVMSFDQTSHLLVRQKLQHIGPTGKVPVEISVSDFRPVSGYLFAHRIETNMSIMTAVQTYTKIEANPDIDPVKFKMPEQHEVVPADPKQQVAAPVKSSNPEMKK